MMFGYLNGNKDRLEKKENNKQETRGCTCKVSKRGERNMYGEVIIDH